MQTVEKLTEGNYYHIYNRGVDGINLFESAADFTAFLKSYEHYTKDVLNTLAYCLMRNHFHFLAYVKENVILERVDGRGLIKLNASRQLGHLFNSYAQSFNSRYSRTGGLFEKPFERKYVDEKDYLTSAILYIHNNPIHHGFAKIIDEWPHSSYQSLLDNKTTFLDREFVLNLFGGKENFVAEHSKKVELIGLKKWGYEVAGDLSSERRLS